MPIECRQTTTGGKGNLGLFIERDPKVVAAGLPTAQHAHKVSDSLEHYLLKDEVDALISDAIIPPPKTPPLPPLLKSLPLDVPPHAPYFSSRMRQVIRPKEKTKFETLSNEFKETLYSSYWKAQVGQVRDPIPMLPEGFDIRGTTFGKPTAFHGRLYDIVMPKEPLPDKTPRSKAAGVQADRKYCAPPYNPDLVYGHRTFIDKRGRRGQCCVTDDNIIEGKGNKMIVNSTLANVLDVQKPRLGSALTPNNNLAEVPTGYSFGILKPPSLNCFTYCELNEGIDFFRSCMKHLNTVRKSLSTRFLPSFFRDFYLRFKYYDTEKTGWLPKDMVYKACGKVLIRFDPELIEPLLAIWKAFDGSKIKYETFVRVINYRIPSPEIPKMPMFQADCLDYRTTYTEMVKPGQEPDSRRMAGLPSGRYFDLDFPITPLGCCTADRTCLPHESDMKSCIAPSILTQCFVSHRDMYSKQEPANVKRVFEATGEKFSEEMFNTIWKEAQKYHSQGWVCYETFYRAWKKYSDDTT